MVVFVAVLVWLRDKKCESQEGEGEEEGVGEA